MAKDGNASTAAQRLRFPEFARETLRDVQLGDVTAECTTRNGKSLTSAPIMGVSKTEGIVPMEVRLIGKDLSRYKSLEADCFAYNPMRLNIGSIARWKGEREVLVSPDYVVFRCLNEGDSAINPVFLDHFRGSDQWEDFVTGSGDGGVRIRIYYKDLARLPLRLPLSTEQQKIADCLTSLDEVIAAQGRKVAALAAHKRGLMQQLFPREGETLPRLRFPEFQGAGEWETKRVDDRGDVLAGKALAVNALGPLRPYLRTKNVLDGTIDLSDVLTMPMTDAEFSRFEILDGDILLNEGQSLELVGRTSIYRGEFRERCAMQNQLLRFRAFPPTCPEFAAQAFRQCQKNGTFASIATQTTSVAHLGSSRFSALALTWPPSHAEQQRIAACLSALDAQTAAESEKLNALKTHKKGLMQQLFPAADTSQKLLAENDINQHVAHPIPFRAIITSKANEPAAVPSRKPYTVGFARQLLAAEILQHCHKHPTMGRVKLQKLIHLCEYHAELDDIHGNYARAAAGPFDNKLMRGVANGLEKQKWFKQVRGEKRTSYELMESSGQHAKYLQRWSEQLPKIHEIIRLFTAANTLSCEIASTLYAAWNDLLIDGRQPTDEEIIREASDPKRWHESKAIIEKGKWPTALKWMREHGLVPRGYGAHTTKRDG